MADSTGANAIKLVGELIVPGASHLLDGNFKSGALHFVGGVLARAVVGPAGYLVVAANSYSSSVTGKLIYEHFTQ